MALFLVQHGISSASHRDQQKELTEKGKKETKRIAEVAKSYNIGVEKIIHSGKKRAEQTALLFHQALLVKTPMEKVSGINPLDDVHTFSLNIGPESALMVVSHMPFLQRLVSLLTCGAEDVRVYQFQNSGIVCLDAEVGNNGPLDWFIKWTLNPHIS